MLSVGCPGLIKDNIPVPLYIPIWPMIKFTRRYINCINFLYFISSLLRVNLNRCRSQFVEFVHTYDNASGNVIRI